jgi:hypothetical protein
VIIAAAVVMVALALYVFLYGLVQERRARRWRAHQNAEAIRKMYGRE